MTKQYTNSQIAAINCINKNLQLIACAGSGKTEIVSKRTVNILKSVPGIKPENIVAFTFTEKAAEELKSRIYEKVREEIGEIFGFAEMYIGTIHGFCLSILQNYVSEYQKFTVLDDIKTKIFIDKYSSVIGMKHFNMKRFKDIDIYVTLIGILRESEIKKEDIPEHVQKALDDYNACFLKNNFFDYSMIMEKAIWHLETDDALRKKIAARIKYLIVDEYQDVNPIQEKLIRIIHELGANICVVGDDDQAIYQWRGSEIENILTFGERYQEVELIYLEDNFRSSSGIIDIAQSTIANNVKRLSKQMKAKSGYQYEKTDIMYQEFDDPWKESEYIAYTIKHLLKAGLRLSDIAILIRIKRIGNEIIRALDRHNIKFIVEGVNELFTTHEAKASKAIFYYLNGKISKKELKMAWLFINHRFDEKMLERAIEELDSWLPQKYKYYHDYIFQRIFYGFLDSIELKEEENSANPSLEIIMYNLGKFSQVIHDFEIIYFKISPKEKLENFCRFLRYKANKYYPEGHLKNTYIRPDAVKIMTIHQAKGLEFGAVFVPGLSKNIFPLKRFGGKSVWHYLDKNLVKNPERYESWSLEDERRLFYVAITRSRKFLYLTRAIYGLRMNRRPSQFLIEANMSQFIHRGLVNYAKRAPVVMENKEPSKIILNFSILKDYYACPYRFKLSFFYGFIQPVVFRIGYGKALHNVIMEIHRKVADKEPGVEEHLDEIIEKHFYLPYASLQVREDMRKSADRSIKDYFQANQADFDKIRFIEKDIEMNLGNGVRIRGRMDLVKRKDLGEEEKTLIVDFKTEHREITESITEEQLNIYALGYNGLTGKDADYIEVYNLDNNESSRKTVGKENLKKTQEAILGAASDIIGNRLNKHCHKEKCKDCYLNYLCLTKQKKKEFNI